MKVFVVFSALLAVASASHLYFAPRFIAPAASSQYHSQDGIGQYAYGYNDHLSTKQEVKSLDGTTRGSYSYIDSNNILQTVDYTADAGGFRVAATNLPKAPVATALELPKQIEDTAEVAAAKSAHFAAIQQAKSRGPSKIDELPRQVEDTIEVATAKAAHFAAIEAAKQRSWDQGSVVWAQAPTELPRQVQDTWEVAVAKAAHFAAIEAAKQRNWDQGSVVWAQGPTELPRQVQDTYEVAAAKAAHFVAIEEAKRRNGDQGSAVWTQTPIELPKPVVDTPEVAKAKAEHLIAIENAKSRNRLQQQIDGGVLHYYGAPLRAPIHGEVYGALPLSRSFSYSSSVAHAPVVQYVGTPW